MMQWDQNQEETMEGWPPETAVPTSPQPLGGLLAGFRGLWQWHELAAEVNQESRARVAIIGLPQSGKSLLFNRLRGWKISDAVQADADFGLPSLMVESYGAFVLADLPLQMDTELISGESFLMVLGEPDLLVYLVDGTIGVQPADFRWVALLRHCGRPVLVVVNKCDAVVNPESVQHIAQHRLGIEPIMISAATGENVESVFLPALLDAAPRLAVPLGREITSMRRTAARRVVRQAALLAGLMSAQPVPLLDLPFQAMLQVGIVMRVGAAYGYPPTGGVNREVVGTVVSTLGMNYLIQTAVKFVPVVGSIVGGVLGIVGATLIGEGAIHYYEAGAIIPLRHWLERPSRWWQHLRHGRNNDEVSS